MLELLTWIGSIAFAICGVPLAYQGYKEGHMREQNWPFLLLWFVGEVCMLAVWTIRGELAMLSNYIFNFICLSAVLYYKIRPRTRTAQ